MESPEEESFHGHFAMRKFRRQAAVVLSMQGAAAMALEAAKRKSRGEKLTYWDANFSILRKRVDREISYAK